MKVDGGAFASFVEPGMSLVLVGGIRLARGGRSEKSVVGSRGRGSGFEKQEHDDQEAKKKGKRDHRSGWGYWDG